VSVKEIVLPEIFAGMTPAHHTIEYFELARALQHEYRHHRALLSDAIASRIEKGLACPPADYEAALALREQCRQQLAQQVFGEADILLAPAAPGEAPAGLNGTGKAVFNRLWTALGLPALSLPGFKGPAGLPVGVQLISRSRQDTRLLAHAAWLEAQLAQRQ
jgi:Asp-tRNA(Asn)/Glu-tRNA(Gln) amidotransferase A subunit family amidase